MRPIALVALLALAGCGAHPAPHRPPARATPVAIAVGGGPVGLAVQGARTWVADADGSRLVGIEGDRVVARVPTGATPLRIAADANGVWVADFGAGTISRVEDGRVTRRVRVGSEDEGIATGFGAVWVVLQASHQLARVAHGVRRIPVGREPRLVTTGFGAVYVSDFGGGTVSRVEPRALSVLRAHACAGPQGIAAVDNRIWVACTDGDEVVALDPDTLRVDRHVALPGAPDGIAGAGGRVYVALDDGPSLAVIDAASGRVLRRTRLADGFITRANTDVAVSPAGLYVSSYDEGRVYRLPR